MQSINVVTFSTLSQRDLRPYDLHLVTLTEKGISQRAAWYCCHKCGQDILIKDHEIEIIGAKITIRPSLVCPTEGCTGHYHITNSEVIE